VKHTVIPIAEGEKWDRALADLGDPDIYFTSRYHSLCETAGDGHAFAYSAISNGNHLFFPFLRTLDGVKSGYGYGGPLLTGSIDELQSLWEPFKPNLFADGAFIRFHPYMQNQDFAPPGMEVKENRQTCSVRLISDLDLDEKQSSKHRYEVRHAESLGMKATKVPLADYMKPFRLMYCDTMRDLGAKQYYLFSKRYFDYLKDELADSAHLFFVHHADGSPACAGLFLQHRRMLHYHLSGNMGKSPGCMNLLLDAAARWGMRNGCLRLHLGGGRTAEPNDSLYLFKKRVSTDTLPFHIGNLSPVTCGDGLGLHKRV